MSAETDRWASESAWEKRIYEGELRDLLTLLGVDDYRTETEAIRLAAIEIRRLRELGSSA